LSAKAAILIVNGGGDARWLPFCVGKVLERTAWQNYHLYVWDNDSNPSTLPEHEHTTIFSGAPQLAASQLETKTELLCGAPGTDADFHGPLATLSQRNHAIPLQRLREAAVADGADYIVTLDTDAHPIKDSWLTALISALDGTIMISGIWRDEMSEEIKPYIHPSCLCTTTRFLESNKLRLDSFPMRADTKTDTLSHLTEAAFALGFDVHRLLRSNRNQLHWIIGGIYGDLIYHQGGGSRPVYRFRGRRGRHNSRRVNQRTKAQATILLFNHYDRYIDWLRGCDICE